MKKYSTFLAAILFALCTATSCQTKSDRIDELKDFVQEIANDGKDYTEEQWEKVDEKFEDLLEEVESYKDLTPEEVKEIARIQGEYAAVAIKKNSKKLMKEMEKAGEKLDGFLDGLKEEMKEE